MNRLAHLVQPKNCDRPAFTLVEMLISVGLVLLMMSLFASAFVNATSVLSQQRGIAENDQRGRMLSTVLRDDLDNRTFRNLLPYLSNDSLTPAPPGREGYFEIDEGDPSDDTDDVLQFTATIAAANSTGTRYSGLARSLTSVSILTITAPSTLTIQNDIGDFSTCVGPAIWISGSSGVDSGGNLSSVDGRYAVASAVASGTVGAANGITTITLSSTTPIPASVTVNAGGYGVALLSESDAEFDDAQINNGATQASTAEICYFIRNRTLYRRVLLVRDTNVSMPSQQPSWTPSLTTTIVGGASFYSYDNYPNSAALSTSFWRDFDYAAFYVPSLFQFPSRLGNVSSTLTAGVTFHDASSSLTNVTAGNFAALASLKSLGLPFQRFGHSVSTNFAASPPPNYSLSNVGLPQDSTAKGILPGADGIYGNGDDIAVGVGRYTLQECSHQSFGYPGSLRNDPISAAAATNPFDRQNIHVDPSTGLAVEYTSAASTAPIYPRRGQDVLLANVLGFDVKVWDPINAQFVDVGDSTLPNGPFHKSAPLQTSGVNIVGGRLNSTYGPDGHYRFDTWHPDAAVYSSTFTGDPPYIGGVTTSPPLADYTYPQPPYMPAWTTPGGPPHAFPLSAIQLTVTYQDMSSKQIRTMTMVQSLLDNPSLMTMTTFNSLVPAGGTVIVPTF